jgi:hypothetical protein
MVHNGISHDFKPYFNKTLTMLLNYNERCPLSLGFRFKSILFDTCQNTKNVGNILYHLAQRYAYIVTKTTPNNNIASFLVCVNEKIQNLPTTMYVLKCGYLLITPPTFFGQPIEIKQLLGKQ